MHVDSRDQRRPHEEDIAALIVAAWNRGAIDSDVAPVLAEGMILHGPRPDGVEGFAGNANGKAAFLAHLRQLRGALGADARMDLISAIAQDGRVAAIYRFDGVHAGPYLGVPPTGRPLTLTVQDSYRMRNGEVIEAWHAPDRFSLIDAMSAAVPIEARGGSVQVELVAALPPGCFPESIVEYPSGDLYVTLQFDGQIIRIANGETSLFAQLPAEAMTGFLAGMVTLNVDEEGRIVVVVLSDNPNFQGVWAYDVQSGDGDRLAALPCLHNHLNGSAIDAAGRIYIADSTLGIIWQVVEGEPQGRVWVRDPLLAPRQYVGLAPGANGLRFRDGALYVTNSDKGTVIRVPIRDDGSAGVATVYASGVPGDDFAIDDDGSMYVTTHVHDSVVKIDPAGKVLGAVATAVEGIVGSTAAIIVRDDHGAKWLYVTNDGGLLAPPGSGPPRPNVSRLRLDAAHIENNQEV